MVDIKLKDNMFCEKNAGETLKPEISLLIVCYNGEKYLKQCLDSVKNQTHKNFRLIFVDDGSEDKTSDIFSAWMKSSKRSDIDFVYVHTAHQKQAAACKEGLKYVTGEVFAWADADDILFPEFLEEYVNYFKINPEKKIVRSNSVLMDEDLKTKIGRTFEEPYLKEIEGIEYMLISGELSSQGSGIYAIKTDLLKEIYGADEFPLSPAGQNFQLLLPALSREKCGFINKELYCYRIRKDSDSHLTRSLPEVLARIDDFYELLKKLAPLCGSKEDRILEQAEIYREKERRLAMKQAASKARERIG